jgi:hypothetical protein
LSQDSDTSLVVEVLGMVEDGEAGKDLWEAAKCVCSFDLSTLSVLPQPETASRLS